MVGGNWKCNGTVSSVKQLVDGLNAASVPDDVDIVCAPTALHVSMVNNTLDKQKYMVGAQNCWTGPGGAFTGEIAADQLQDMGIPWVITGHSERRALCGESSKAVGTKTAYALSKGVKVIACIGETLDERNDGHLEDVLEDQMSALREVVEPQSWAKLAIAYEPVWAIGTGVVASPAQAQDVHAFLRKWVSKNVSVEVAKDLRILYGGSVKANNCVELAQQEDIDGFLVGGASLDAKEFAAICNANANVASAA